MTLLIFYADDSSPLFSPPSNPFAFHHRPLPFSADPFSSNLWLSFIIAVEHLSTPMIHQHQRFHTSKSKSTIISCNPTFPFDFWKPLTVKIVGLKFLSHLQLFLLLVLPHSFNNKFCVFCFRGVCQTMSSLLSHYQQPH